MIQKIFYKKKKKVISKDTDRNIKIKVYNGNYHILNILTKFIRNKDIYSVYNKEHPLCDEILLEYRLNKTNKDYEKYLEDLISEINKNISKIIIS